MALTITSVTRDGGAACNHVTIVVSQEGTSRTFKTSFGEIDAMFTEMSTVEQLKMLVCLWAKYRRTLGRSVVAVDIA